MSLSGSQPIEGFLPTGANTISSKRILDLLDRSADGDFRSSLILCGLKSSFLLLTDQVQLLEVFCIEIEFDFCGLAAFRAWPAAAISRKVGMVDDHQPKSGPCPAPRKQLAQLKGHFPVRNAAMLFQISIQRRQRTSP